MHSLSLLPALPAPGRRAAMRSSAARAHDAAAPPPFRPLSSSLSLRATSPRVRFAQRPRRLSLSLSFCLRCRKAYLRLMPLLKLVVLAIVATTGARAAPRLESLDDRLDKTEAALRSVAAEEVGKHLVAALDHTGNCESDKINSDGVLDLGDEGEIPDGAYTACTNIVKVIAPRVTQIGWNAFASCYKLEEVLAPEVTRVNGAAFFQCYNLKTFTLGTLEWVGLGAFFRTYNYAEVAQKAEGLPPPYDQPGATLDAGLADKPVVPVYYGTPGAPDQGNCADAVGGILTLDGGIVEAGCAHGQPSHPLVPPLAPRRHNCHDPPLVYHSTASAPHPAHTHFTTCGALLSRTGNTWGATPSRRS